MASTKQYKAIGDDLWKSKTDKIVCILLFLMLYALTNYQFGRMLNSSHSLMVLWLYNLSRIMKITTKLTNSWRRCTFLSIWLLLLSYFGHLNLTSCRGYNIGTRLIEDFLARSALGKCADFREVGEVVAKVTNLCNLKSYFLLTVAY